MILFTDMLIPTIVPVCLSCCPVVQTVVNPTATSPEDDQIDLPKDGSQVTLRPAETTQVVEERLEPAAHSSHQSWSVSTGRHQTFTVDSVQAVDIEAAVATMCDYAFILTRGAEAPEIDPGVILAHVRSIACQFDTKQGIVTAMEAAREFSFPPEVYIRDQEVFDTTGSLTRVIESVQTCGLEDRFNAERTQLCIPSSYPQFELVMEIATDGAPIELPEGFIPSGGGT